MRAFLSKIINIYKLLISPYFNSCQCKYYPTCSDYALLALKKYKILKASVKIIYRLIKCNPWTKGGIDFP